ncbi:MAG TPA: hypothetical protein VFS00_24615 [Polyangiaceae bacterium]|nr:hypothetical protein [Polyangiaceae bacterium]
MRQARRALAWPLGALLFLAARAASAEPARGVTGAPEGATSAPTDGGRGASAKAGGPAEPCGPRLAVEDGAAGEAGGASAAKATGVTSTAGATGGASAAGGADTAGAAGGAAPCPARSPWAVGAAVVPGLLVHGAGHYVAGNKRTAGRLLALEAAGIGAVGGGLVTLALTGASRRLVAPVATFTIAGVGLFAISTLADLYGVLAPPGGTGEPLRVAPRFAAELGLRHVYDPVFPYGAFSYQALEVRLGGLRLSQSGWHSLNEHRNRRLRFEGAWRFVGPRPEGGERASDGSFLDVEAAFTDHDYGSDGFGVTTGEASLRGRLDLGRVGPTLAGSFAEFGAGLALASNRYDRHTDEGDDLLLGGFAFGAYFGRRADRWGEAKIYYDHRHDGFAAGLKMRGLGSGVPGHFGARALFFFDRSWGAQAEVEAGSAYVTGLSVLYRYGVSR